MGVLGTGIQLSLARHPDIVRALPSVHRASRFEIPSRLDQSFARVVQRPALSNPAPPSKMSRSTILLLICVQTHVSPSKTQEEGSTYESGAKLRDILYSKQFHACHHLILQNCAHNH